MNCSPPGSSFRGVSQVRILEYSRVRRGLPFPPPGDLQNSGVKPTPPAWQADYFPLSPQGSPLLFYLFSIINTFQTDGLILFNPSPDQDPLGPDIALGVRVDARPPAHSVTGGTDGIPGSDWAHGLVLATDRPDGRSLTYV